MLISCFPFPFPFSPLTSPTFWTLVGRTTSGTGGSWCFTVGKGERYWRISWDTFRVLIASSKGLSPPGVPCSFPNVWWEAIINNCLSQSINCCNVIFAKPLGCSQISCENKNWTQGSTTSYEAIPDRSIANDRLWKAARNFNSELASQTTSELLVDNFSIPWESVAIVGSFLTALTSWALLVHCSGLTYCNVLCSNISTKVSTKWFEGMASGLKMTPPSLFCWASCLANRSAAGNLRDAAVGSGLDSTRIRTSAKARVCHSKNKRLRTANWLGSNSVSASACMKSTNGLSFWTCGLWAIENGKLPKVFQCWARNLSSNQDSTPKALALSSKAAVESSVDEAMVAREMNLPTKL